MEDHEILRLSDAFLQNSGHHKLELEVDVYNVNDGRSPRLMSACQTLKEYAAFVGRIRKHQMHMPNREAVTRGIDECIEEGILVDFLKRNKEEVLGACLYEFDQQAYERVIREEEFAAGKAEGREEGRKEGREEGRRSFIYEWVRAGKLSRQEGAAELHQTEQEFLIEMNAYFKEPPEGTC